MNRTIKMFIICSLTILLTACGDNPDNLAIRTVSRLVESNDSDVNRELGVYMLGASGNVQRVNSANCSIKDGDNYGRYVLYCSIDYTGHTTGSGIDKSGTGSVYVGYLNIDGDNFKYKFGSTSYSNADALKNIESKICWNNSSLSMDCNANNNTSINKNGTKKDYESNDNNKKGVPSYDIYKDLGKKVVDITPDYPLHDSWTEGDWWKPIEENSVDCHGEYLDAILKRLSNKYKVSRYTGGRGGSNYTILVKNDEGAIRFSLFLGGSLSGKYSVNFIDPSFSRYFDFYGALTSKYADEGVISEMRDVYNFDEKKFLCDVR